MDAYKQAYLKLFNRTGDVMDELLHILLEREAIITETPSPEDTAKEADA